MNMSSDGSKKSEDRKLTPEEKKQIEKKRGGISNDSSLDTFCSVLTADNKCTEYEIVDDNARSNSRKSSPPPEKIENNNEKDRWEAKGKSSFSVKTDKVNKRANKAITELINEAYKYLPSKNRPEANSELGPANPQNTQQQGDSNSIKRPYKRAIPIINRSSSTNNTISSISSNSGYSNYTTATPSDPTPTDQTPRPPTRSTSGDSNTRRDQEKRAGSATPNTADTDTRWEAHSPRKADYNNTLPTIARLTPPQARTTPSDQSPQLPERHTSGHSNTSNTSASVSLSSDSGHSFEDNLQKNRDKSPNGRGGK